MKKTLEDNTISVIQRAIKYFQIPVTRNSVKESLKSHPYYPALKSICDTLQEWNVEQYALKYKPEDILEISAPYIVHFNNGGGQIAFVSEIKNDLVTYYDSYKTLKKISFQEFVDKCSGVVILLRPCERSGEKNYKEKLQKEIIIKAILPVIFLALLLFLILSMKDPIGSGNIVINWTKGLLVFTKTVGITLSVLLTLYEFEIHFSFTDKLCHLNKATNCNTVLNDKASKIFGGFGWADLGILYFTGSLLYLLQNFNRVDLPLLALLAAMSIPYPLFSIYYQGFALKKWCPMCLGVQLILIIEFILLLPQFSQFSFSFNTLLSFILTFLVIVIIYTLFLLLLKEKMSNEVHYSKYLGFKKNPDILKTLLMNKTHYDIPVTESSLVFGDINSTLAITVFLSLHCSHCARAFEKIRNILKSEGDILFNLVLMTSDNEMLTTLYNYQGMGDVERSLRLLDLWFNADSYSRTRITEGLCGPEDRDISGKINEVNERLFRKCEVLGTPTFFINGYKLPNQYDIDDIRYFRDIIKEEENVLIGKDTVNR